MTIVYKTPAGNDVIRTIRELVDTLLAGVNKNFPSAIYGGTSTERKLTIKAIQGRLTTGIVGTIGYRAAKEHLVNMLGEYCSYCEKRGDLDVEHRLPKGIYPYGFVLWSNFLLGCTSCNSSKGSTKPPRGRARQWANAQIPAPPQPLTEETIMMAAKDHFFWPDTDADTYRRLIYNMKDVGNGYANIDIAQRSTIQWVTYTEVGTQVHITMQPTAGAPAASITVEVTVEAAPGVGGAAKTMDTIGENMLNLIKRRQKRNNDRTKKWFEILLELSLLDRAIAGAPTDQDKRERFDLQWDSILQKARSIGYYSCWVRILSTINYPNYLPPSVHATLAQKFVQDTIPNPGTTRLRTIPGTNVNQVP